MKSGKLVRAEGLIGYVELGRSLKLDTARLLRDVGLARVDFSNSELMISAAALTELLEKSAVAAKIEDFGLRLSAMRSLAHAGPLGLLLREQPTLRDALRAAEAFLSSYSDTMGFRLEESDPAAAVVRISYVSASRGYTRQVTEFLLGTAFRTFSAIAGKAWAPESISFSHPPPTSPTVHKAFFKTRLLFDSSFNGFLLRGGDLGTRIRTDDREMERYIRHYVESIASRRSIGFDTAVRRLIFALLPTGRCTGALVAKHLGVDRVTVNRRLAVQGATLSSIRQDVRMELARRYIVTDRRSLTQTAQLLGFGGLASFSRWFRRSFGRNASAWRDARRADRHRRTRGKPALR